jgi:diguanylate cyclase (GGDEF)-like protein/PAS domain S-box-containing protein
MTSTEFDAFDASPVPMWVFDLETLRIVAANPAMERAYGYTRGELLAMSIFDLRMPEDRDVLAAYVRRPRADRPQGLVWTHRDRDGCAMRVAIYSCDVRHAGRDARLVVAHDVGAQELAQERVHLIARAMSDAAYDFDVASGAIWFSESFLLNFGYHEHTAPTDVEGWARLVHPDDYARVAASLAAALEGSDEDWVQEYCFQRGDGTYTDVLERGYIQRDSHGRAVRMVGGMIDQRPQRLLSARLRLLERAIDAGSTGLLIADALDPSYPIVYANPAFEQITGYAAEAVEGRPFDFLQALEPGQPGARMLLDALREMREAQAPLRGVRPDGETFWCDYRFTPMRDGGGRVTHLMALLVDVSERQRHAQQLAWRSTHDVLTGLPNRHLMLDMAVQSVQRAEQAGTRVAAVVVDLDEFKLVNDEFGHAAGDRVLVELGARLARVGGAGAVLARSVGDEFVLLVEGSDEMRAEMLASAVHAALAEPIDAGDGRRCKLTACVGYSHYPEDAAGAESLLMSAELAMHQAKKQGRNCTVAYRAGKMPVTTGKLQLLQELREALERKEFRLLFQPVFSADLQLVALEALVRWEHPRRGLLPPSDFIAVCEESGLIVELGRRVLHEAARHHALLAERGLAHVRIAVNVSAMQFSHGLLEDVERIVREFDLPEGALELELTESVIVDDPDRAAQAMIALAKLGVTVAIDDFGVGYSSLSYLKRLPIHRLKIDRSFVNDLESDASDRSICEAVIALARTLRLGVVAEGVESTFQRDWLRNSGAGELQGYLFARPVPFEDATAQVAAGA